MGVPVVGGIRFGPTPNGKVYISLNAHRGARPWKTVWNPNITPQMEYGLFERSDVGDWTDPRGHYWSFAAKDGSVCTGQTRERLAKHPKVSNATDPWHGYPVSPLRTGDADAPADDLVAFWLKGDVITRTFARRILDRRI